MQHTTTTAPAEQTFVVAREVDGSDYAVGIVIVFAVVLVALSFLPRYWTPERIDAANR